MTEKKSKNKKIVRDVYKTSCERIAQILNLFGQINLTGISNIPSESDLEKTITILKIVLQSQLVEEDNCYKEAIFDAGCWVLEALRKNYLKTQQGTFPPIIYIVKKGIEVLHLLLHRDLRRNKLSSTESQLYFEFLKLTEPFPPPYDKKNNSKEIEDYYANLLKSS